MGKSLVSCFFLRHSVDYSFDNMDVSVFYALGFKMPISAMVRVGETKSICCVILPDSGPLVRGAVSSWSDLSAVPSLRPASHVAVRRVEGPRDAVSPRWGTAHRCRPIPRLESRACERSVNGAEIGEEWAEFKSFVLVFTKDIRWLASRTNGRLPFNPPPIVMQYPYIGILRIKQAS